MKTLAEEVTRWAPLQARLREEIRGQEEATAALVRAVLRGEMGWIEPGRPRSFLLLLGETGVGKTESVLVLAEALHGTRDTVIRLDMAEYVERASGLARLLGEGPGDPGLLGAALRRARAAQEGRGGTIFLLLDEIEKAHPDLTRLFLGMEAARLTTASGLEYDLSDVHIVCTSNLGSEAMRGLAGAVPTATLRRVVEEEARGFFGSAVWARFSEVLLYRSLSPELQQEICRQKVERKAAYLATRLGRPVEVETPVIDWVFQRGWHRDLGARHLRHAIDRELGDAASRWVLQCAGRVGAGPLRLRVAGHDLILESAQ